MATTKVSTKLLETVGIAEGGTGATSASAARTSLGIGAGGGGWLGESGSPLGTSADIVRLNEQTLNNSIVIVGTDNASATGPLAIASGVTVTVSSGSTFVVI